MKYRNRLLSILKKPIMLMMLVLLFSLCGCGKQNHEAELETYVEALDVDKAETVTQENVSFESSDIVARPEDSENDVADIEVFEDGVYTSKDDVALYIHIYGKLPGNFITKKAAKKLGWPGGSLEEYAPGKCIGGGYFGNYEGLLPEKEGRVYHECDIDTLGKSSRGAKRIIYSNDGLIYYTGDHYESFELLYGEP